MTKDWPRKTVSDFFQNQCAFFLDKPLQELPLQSVYFSLVRPFFFACRANFLRVFLPEAKGSSLVQANMKEMTLCLHAVPRRKGFNYKQDLQGAKKLASVRNTRRKKTLFRFFFLIRVVIWSVFLLPTFPFLVCAFFGDHILPPRDFHDFPMLTAL